MTNNPLEKQRSMLKSNIFLIGHIMYLRRLELSFGLVVENKNLPFQAIPSSHVPELDSLSPEMGFT